MVKRFMCFLVFFAMKPSLAGYLINHMNPTYVSASMIQVSNTLGKYTITATQVQGSVATQVFTACSTLPGVRYSSSSVIMPNKMTLTNKKTGMSYVVPVKMDNPTSSSSTHYVRSAYEYKQWNPGPIQCGKSGSKLAHTTVTEAYATFDFKNIPGGEYTTNLNYGALNCQGTTTAECESGLLAFAESGYVGTGTVIKVDIVVPDTTSCSADSVLIDHGKIPIYEVNGNLKSGSLTVRCTGAASYTITTKQNSSQNLIKIYDGMDSRLTINNVNTDTVKDSLSGAGYKQYQLWSQLQTTKTPPEGRFDAAGVVKIDYN
ncbi:TPA: fimbrial protein [Salmonella enterica]|nr:fimbrial protein [Salmonella enterica]